MRDDQVTTDQTDSDLNNFIILVRISHIFRFYFMIFIIFFEELENFTRAKLRHNFSFAIFFLGVVKSLRYDYKYS